MKIFLLLSSVFILTMGNKNGVKLKKENILNITKRYSNNIENPFTKKQLKINKNLLNAFVQIHVHNMTAVKRSKHKTRRKSHKIIQPCSLDEFSNFRQNVDGATRGQRRNGREWENDEMVRVFYEVRAGKTTFSLLFKIYNNFYSVIKACNTAKAYRENVSKLVKTYGKWYDGAVFGVRMKNGIVLYYNNYSVLKYSVCNSKLFKKANFVRNLTPPGDDVVTRIVGKTPYVRETGLYSRTGGVTGLGSEDTVECHIECRRFIPEDFKLFVTSRLSTLIMDY